MLPLDSLYPLAQLLSTRIFLTLKHKELTQLQKRRMTLRTVHSGNDRVYHTNAASFVKDCNLCRNKARQQLLMPRVNTCNFRISRALGKNSWGSVHELGAGSVWAHLNLSVWLRKSWPCTGEDLSICLVSFKLQEKKKKSFLAEYGPFNGNTSAKRIQLGKLAEHYVDESCRQVPQIERWEIQTRFTASTDVSKYFHTNLRLNHWN